MELSSNLDSSIRGLMNKVILEDTFCEELGMNLFCFFKSLSHFILLFLKICTKMKK